MNTSNNRARTLALLATSLLMLAASGCARQARSKSQAANQSAAPSDPTIEVSSADSDSSADDPCSQMFSNFFVKVDSIAYNDYEIVKLHRTEHDKPSGMDMPVTYAALKLKGKVVKTFDGVYYPLGNLTDFGFASLLGGETKQLVISEAIPRNGRHWVVDLASNPTTIFDTHEWDLGQEDVCFNDLDGDGIAELSLAIREFCGIGSMAIVECPMISVVFKYDPQVRKYLPDRSGFAHLLTGLEDDVKTIDPNESQGGQAGTYLATRLDIFLRYAYGGRENDGWLFFDRSYNLPDKKEIEQRIRTTLQQEPIYKFVYGKKTHVTM